MVDASSGECRHLPRRQAEQVIEVAAFELRCLKSIVVWRSRCIVYISVFQKVKIVMTQISSSILLETFL